ncbi:MAG: hypothetical protein K0U74_15725 [Alphaproteobacteria bacterium]|nr:hypothetical protein [Alphaproteobacteria bacterium]
MSWGNRLIEGANKVSAGLVYLRPVQIAGFQVQGRLDEAAKEAWSGVSDWIVRKSLTREVEIGYGLIGQCADASLLEDEFKYRAGIKLPTIVTPAEANELHRSKLPGGAYYRRRFSGPVSAITAEFDAFLAEIKDDRNLCVDAERPLVTVVLDLDQVENGQDVRSNLLVPVLSVQASNSPRRAA